jgi:hypothetical protein
MIAYIVSLVKTYIRESIVHNGYCAYGKQELDTYIMMKVLEIREIFDKELQSIDTYVHSEDFSKVIFEIYYHNIECMKHWNSKIKDEMIDFSKRIK